MYAFVGVNGCEIWVAKRVQANASHSLLFEICGRTYDYNLGHTFLLVVRFRSQRVYMGQRALRLRPMNSIGVDVGIKTSTNSDFRTSSQLSYCRLKYFCRIGPE